MLPRLNGVEALRRIRDAQPRAGADADGQGRRRRPHRRAGAGRRRLRAQALHAARAGGAAAGHPAALGRQRDVGQGGPITAGPLTLWPEKRRAEWDGRALDLTSTEFNLLAVLARNAGRVVSKEELSEPGLGRPLARFDRSIDVHVSSLRQKVGTLSDGRSCIQTVRGLGYQFIRE